MRVVAALGGNALLRRGQPPHVSVQRANVDVAAAAIADLAAEHDVIVTHGNGPQVGLLALQSMAEVSAEPTPLDVLDAESEGLIGYLLDQALCNALPGRDVATVLTQTIVDPGDPAFGAPTKPIGPVYGEADARRLAAEHGWSVARDGDGFRRVVASPRPSAAPSSPSMRRPRCERRKAVRRCTGRCPHARRAHRPARRRRGDVQWCHERSGRMRWRDGTCPGGVRVDVREHGGHCAGGRRRSGWRR